MPENNIDNIRHTLAHLLAQAITEKYPEAQLAIGPTTSEGFYYDFDNISISDNDLPEIQKAMIKTAQQGLDMKYEEWDIEKAKQHFKDQPYKLELIYQIEKENKKAGIVHTADQFTDLCQGGHIDNTKNINTEAFSLERVSGAYWHSNEENKMLTRIYGVAFETKEELEKYKENQKEAKKRDHRILGKELDLFTFSPIIGSGLPLFTPRGTALKDALTDYLWELSKKYGYEKVTIPHITKIDLYEKSGHADKFKDEFFTVLGKQSKQEFVLKPMNCPHHTQIFTSRPRSFRDLPIRLTETTVQYRDEKPGELLGLSRLRTFSVDDAHIFCTPDQIKTEISNIVEIIQSFYKTLNLFSKDNFWVSLSVRDPNNPEKYLGKDENWQKAEKYLQEISDKYELNAQRKEGEAAFYGPKLDFMFKDALNREWQLATAQVDFVQPERLELEYTNNRGEKETPVMIHRAISGSLERFISILIEHFAGQFPLWLSPEQVWILPISEKFNDYSEKIHQQISENSIRSVCIKDNESLGKKIRNGQTQKIPHLIIVGEEEQSNNTISVRNTKNNETKSTTLDEFIKETKEKIKNRVYE